ncbi:30S ribosomal protein S6e [Candidatus Pacearchaeota archaeon]|nr:30S ribosomal protein S6e [Candidatus Pacearchaeota archaeon]
MVFKINISHKGKAIKFETDNEEILGLTIGSEVDGKLISADLEGYVLTLTGTSDIAGFPGLPDLKGPTLKRVILKPGIGMHDGREGVRLRKTVRGNEVSTDTAQINLSVKKEGSKKFEEMIKPKEAKK